MKKRILSMIVALSMILTMVPFAVMAEDEAVEPVVIDLGTRMGHTTTKAMYDTDVTGMTQIKTVDGADSGVYYSISADGVLTIKGDKYVQMPTVDTTDQAKSVYGWYGNANVTKVVICEGITSIGVRAFETMSNLAEIQLPSTLVSISAYAFNGVSKLTSIEIPEGATRLENNWIINCSGIKTIKLPTTITFLGFPDGRAESATDWPRGAQKAEWIVYADTYAATTLAANDFGNYSINLPGTEVYNSAKTAATLTTKAFPSTFKGVMETYSKEPSTYADAITYRTSGGIPWSIDVATKTLTLTVTLPDAASTGAAHKGMNALYETPWYHLYNQYIENVVFDNSIGAKTVELPRQLLGYLSNVKELTIPGYVSSAGWALFHSAKYEKVTFEEGVLASTGDNWFIACTALSEVVLPETLTTIANRTFNGCTSLKSLYIPDAVSKINYGLQSDGTTVNSAQDAFTGCTNLVLKYHAKSTAATAIDTYLNATGLTGDNKPTAVSIPYVGYLNDTNGVVGAFKWVVDPDAGTLVVSTVDGVVSNGWIADFEGSDHYAPWYSLAEKTWLTSVTVEEGVKHLPDNFMRTNGAPVDVIIPSTVESGDAFTFNGAKIGELYIKEGANIKVEQFINGNCTVNKIIFPSTMTPDKKFIRDLSFGTYAGFTNKSVEIVAPYNSPAYLWAKERYAEAVAKEDAQVYVDGKATGEYVDYCGIAAENLTITASYETKACESGVVTVANNTGYHVDSAYVIIGYYDEQDNLIAAKISSKQTLAAASNTVEVGTVDGAEKAVVYVWNNFNELKPMANTFSN